MMRWAPLRVLADGSQHVANVDDGARWRGEERIEVQGRLDPQHGSDSATTGDATYRGDGAQAPIVREVTSVVGARPEAQIHQW